MLFDPREEFMPDTPSPARAIQDLTSDGDTIPRGLPRAAVTPTQQQPYMPDGPSLPQQGRKRPAISRSTRPLSPGQDARPRRHGGGLTSPKTPNFAGRRPQSDAARVAAEPRPANDFSRGPGHGGRQQRPRRHDLPGRRRTRHAVPRHGAAPGHDARRLPANQAGPADDGEVIRLGREIARPCRRPRNGPDSP